MQRQTKRRLAWVLVLVLAALYLPAVNGPPALDDVPEFAHVRTLHGLRAWVGRDCFQLWRPVKNLFFVLFDRVAPHRPWVWHAVSLLLFAGGVLLAARYFGILLRDERWGVLAAALWAVAPTQAAVVSWASCVNILVMTPAVFGCLLLHEESWRARGAGAGRSAALSAACLFVALVSYESAVAVVGLAFIHDVYVDPLRLRLWAAWRRYGALAVVTAVYLLVRHGEGGSMQMANDAIVPLPGWLLSGSSAYFALDHLLLWFCPFGGQYVLGTYNAHAQGTAAMLAVCWAAALALVVGAWLGRRWRFVPFAAAWFAAAFAPLSNVIPLRNGPMADYYLVLPSIGLCVLVVSFARKAYGLCRRSRGRATRVGACSALALIAGWALALPVETARWVPAWNSEEALLTATMRSRPDSFRAGAGLARLRAASGRLAEAELYARRAVELAPGFVHGYYALCDVLQRKGEHREALTALDRARELRPGDPAPLVLAGHIHGAILGDAEQSETLYRLALSLPWNHEYSRTAALNLGDAYFRSGQLTNAIHVWQDASGHMPRDPDFHHNLTIGFYKAGRLDLAREHASAAERLGSPVHPNVMNLLRVAGPD